MRSTKFWLALALPPVIVAAFLLLAPAITERNMNRVLPHAPYVISPEAQALHASLTVADMHADSTLWQRDLLLRGKRGQVDIPRLQEGNVGLQIFTSVTRTPAGINYASNTTDARDNITLLALAQAWPPATWRSLTQRALYQAQRLHGFAERAPGQLAVVTNKRELKALLQRRAQGEHTVAGVLGTEGSHALDGELANIDVLYAAGFRVMGLQHFFDNQLGGSLHGQSGAGLTDFGVEAVARMQQRGIIVDVAHSSRQVVREVLAQSKAPVVVSHTGFYGHCPGDRNIPDELMQAVADAGGLIGVGFWDGAVCEITPRSIVAAIRYGINLLGVDHIALGSDFDGAITSSFDSSELAILTQEMLQADFSEQEIRQVMGGNLLRFLAQQLPD